MIKTIMRGNRPIVGGFYLSTAMASVLACSGNAWAECTPNPAQATVTTICSGTETSTLTVAVDLAQVTVDQGAILSAAGANSIIIMPPPLASYTGTRASLTINGTVANTTGSAILLTANANSASPFSYSQQTNITVGPAGVISGPTGIDVAVGLFGYGRHNAIVVNSGTISSSTGGYALRGNAQGTGRFDSITNTETGVIGAISGQVGTLTNRGLIDGGARSAFAGASGPLQYYGQGGIDNSGTIRSSGSDATLVFQQGYNGPRNVQNYGQIINSGTGAAISGLSSLIVLNAADGRITSNATAISADFLVNLENAGAITGSVNAVTSGGGIRLINRGSINGHVVAATAIPLYESVIDNGAGTINGDLLLGDGNDVLIGDIRNFSAPIGIITGRFDAGGGTDSLQFTFSENVTLQQDIPLPQSIEQLQFLIAKDSTLTLAPGFTTSTRLAIGGGDQGYYNIKNQFINNGTIGGLATAGVGGIGVTNNGTVRAALTSASDYAVNLGSISSFSNTGTIIATGGNAVTISVTDARNSGTIVADDTAVYSSANLLNSGTIRSLQGIGLNLTNAVHAPSLNSGTIEGATAGARVGYSVLVNSGTISSTVAGIQIGTGGVVRNTATGVINGGVAPANPLYGTLGSRIVNAGTINGNVDFGAPTGYTTSNVFIAAKGGIVHGDIRLGGGNDVFATALTNSGPGEFAGLTGRVSGGGTETLRYLVDADATATVALRGIFDNLGYDLSNGARLTLSATGTQTFGIGFSGTGAVDLTADFTSDGMSPILDLRQTSLQTTADGTVVPTSLDVVSRGTLTLEHVNPDLFAMPAVALSDIFGSTGNASIRFTNAGTIIVREVSGYNYPYTGQTLRAIAVGPNQTVINSGTILLDGASGISSSSQNIGIDSIRIENSGTIRQIDGGARSSGISVIYGTITNSGTISTEGAAVSFSSAKLVNSGTIASSGGTAIAGLSASSTGQIANAQGGTITGGTGYAAIHLSAGSTLANAGTINGNVSLADSYYSYIPYGSAYINLGGTLNGDLIFGDGDDIVLARDGVTGVTGTIVAGAGTDSFVRGSTASTSVDLTGLAPAPSGFERQGLAALGRDTVVTMTGSPDFGATPLLLMGDGTIVNRATITAASSGSASMMRLGLANQGDIATAFDVPLAFVNEGTLGDGIAGNARSFINSGTIAASKRSSFAVALTLNNPANFIFRNSGSIGTPPSDPANGTGAPRGVIIGQTSTFAEPTDSMAIDNSGTIAGGMSVDAMTRDFTWSNSGQISTTDGYYNSASLTIGRTSYDGEIDTNADRASIANSGTLTEGLIGTIGARVMTFENSGTISNDLQSYTTGNTPYAVDLTQTAHFLAGTQGGLAKAIDQDSAAISNRGSILGQVNLTTYARTVDITNSGTMTIGGGFDSLALGVNMLSLGDQSMTFTNTGSIDTGSTGLSAVSIHAFAGTTGQQAATATLHITNSGAIRADGGAQYLPPFLPWNRPASLYRVAALAVDTIDSETGNVSITNQTGGIISATGATQTQGAAPDLALRLATLGSTAVRVRADTVSLDNAGTIQGVAGGVAPANLIPNYIFGLGYPVLPSGYLAGAIQTFGSTDSIINRASGVITGSIDLGAKDDTLTNAGTITGNIFMGEGNDWLENDGTITGAIAMGAGDDILMMTGSARLNGQADGGDGIDTLVLGATGPGGNDLQDVINFETLVVSGTGWRLAPSVRFDTGIAISTSASLAGNAATLTGPIVNNGTLVVDQTGDGAFAALLSGTGVLVKTGTGSLTMGTLSNFVGAVRIDQGRLALAGYLRGPVFVQNGATLGGNGTVGPTSLAVGATIAPGNSIGTIFVDGAFTAQAGSTYLAETTAAGASDLIVVNGSATIAPGARLSIVRDGGAYVIGRRYVVLTATGRVSGSYTLSQDANALTEFRVGSSASAVYVDVARGGGMLPILARTRNQAAAAAGLAPLGLANAAYSTLLLNPSDEGVRAGLDSLSGEIYASVTTGMVKDAQAVQGAVLGRLTSASGPGVGVWAQALYGVATDNGGRLRGVGRMRSDMTGAIGGVDMGLNDWGRIGVAGGHTRSTLHVDSRSSSARMHATHLAGYLSGRWGPLAVKSEVGYSWTTIDVERAVAFTGFASQLRSRLDGSVLHGTIDAGYTLPLLGGSVEPFARIEGYRTKRDAFAELGDNSAALSSGRRTETAWISTLGARAETPVAARLRGRGQLGWLHAFAPVYPSSLMRFSSGAVPFRVNGVPLAQNAVSAAIGLDWKPSEAVTLSGGYAGTIGKATDESRLSVMLSVGF